MKHDQPTEPSRRTFLRATGLSGLAAAWAATTPTLGTAKTSSPLEEKTFRPRLVINDDGSNFLRQWDELNADDLKAYLSRLKGTHVDMVAYAVAEAGFITYYESKIGDPVGTGFKTSSNVMQNRYLRNRERLQREVGDYIGFVFSTLREMGIAPVASFRMNDAHMSSNPTGPFVGTFWKNHRQWCLGDPYGYYGSCLDYAVPEVRDYLRQLVNEVIQKFPDVAGIELDGMRSPFFFEDGKGRESAPIMTEFMRQIRSDLDAASRARGGPRYVFRVNVPRSPELALECGMDVAAWDTEKLVDAISPGCYGTDFQLPIEQWKTLLSKRMLVQAYVNVGRVGSQYHSLEEYRGAAANAYAAGSDGMYLFNIPCLDELSTLLPRPVAQGAFPPQHFQAQGWHPDLTRARLAYSELDDPKNLVRKNKKYLFYTNTPTYRHTVQEKADIQRSKPEPAKMHFRCYEDAAEAKEMRLELKTVGVSTFDQFDFLLNGQPIPPSRIERLHAPGGRDARVHPAKLAPYSQYVIDVLGNLERGENQLTVTLTKQDPDVIGKIPLQEMELFVNYD